MATKTNTEINGKKYYRITRTIGHEYKDGKKVPIKKQFLGTSKGNAEKKYEAWKEAQANKNKSITETLKTFGELADFYCENVLEVSSEYARSTIDRYTGAYQTFKKKDRTGILDILIRNITAADLQMAYNKLDVPQSTIQTINKFFRGFFRWAILNRYCTDILSAVTIPVKPLHKKKDGIVIWSEDEMEAIGNSLGTYRLRLLIVLGTYSGMRISELLGLRYSDIDSGIIHVRRQYYRGYLTEPKYKSFRDIPLHIKAKNELELHKEWHLKEMSSHGYKTDFIFTTNQGGMLDYTNVKRSLNRFYKRNGIPEKSFHTYRATFCTNLCRAGVPVQTAAVLMGHKSIDVTARFYTFVSDRDKIDAVMLLE